MRQSRHRRQRLPSAAALRGRDRKDRLGASAVEFAIVAPLFFALVFGLIEFGRVTMIKQALSNAASVGCRTASLATTVDVDQVEDAVRQQLASFMSASGDGDVCRISVEPSDFSEIERDDEITVTVEVNFSDVSWMTASYLQSAVLHAQASMTRE